jgi:hypothetical protein
MGSLDGPYSLTLQVLLTLLIIELGWGIAVLVAWLFGSIIVFYAVGLIATGGSLVGAFYYFTGETALEREEPPDIF